MKRFILNLEKDYLAAVFVAAGILLIAFPEHFSKVAPYVLGGALILHGIVIVVLVLRYKDSHHGPGKAIVYFSMGLTILFLGGDALAIIGVIWAVFSLIEVSDEINEMWAQKKYSVLGLVASAISIGLAIVLMTDPFRHFAVHVRVLGFEILVSCIARRASIMKRES